MTQLLKFKESKEYFSKKVDFTRNRTFTFLTMFFLISDLPRKSLSVEVSKGLELINGYLSKGIEGGKSGFCKARKKIKPELFEAINRYLVELFYQKKKLKLKRWKGFILKAVDGAILDLVDTPAVRMEFGVQKNQHGSVPQGRMMLGYDVLNGLIIDCELGKMSIGEANVIKTWISKTEQDHLFIYDRLFPGLALQYLHQKYSIPYVMRCKLGHNNQVTAFLESGKKGKIEEWPLHAKALTQIRKFGLKVSDKAKIQVRMLRVELDNGETEILITNLTDTKKFPHRLFKEVYNLRWGVETEIGHLKNVLQIEIGSGQTVESIYQDFFATIFRANVQVLIEKDCKKKVKKKNKERKYTYKINRSVAAGILKGKLPALFLSKDKAKIYQQLLTIFSKNLEPIRKGRSFPRKKKAIKINGKYKPLKNYKRVA